jgi:hypothetical protein
MIVCKKNPNASIAYRILLTIHVTVVSAERSFLKLKLIKFCLRSTIRKIKWISHIINWKGNVKKTWI